MNGVLSVCAEVSVGGGRCSSGWSKLWLWIPTLSTPHTLMQVGNLHTRNIGGSWSYPYARSNVRLWLIVHDDTDETKHWNSCVGNTFLTLGQSVGIAECAVFRVLEVNGISPHHSAVHVVIIPTYVLGNASASITHELPCDHVLLLTTITLYTHPYNPAALL